jgi:hypothetical protein
VTAISSRSAPVPSRKDFKNVNLHVKRYTVNTAELGVAKVPLVASDAAAGVFSWRNMENATIIVDRVVLYVSTKSTGACTLDIGKAATEILNDTLLDGVDVGTAAGSFDSMKDAGTNGAGAASVAQGQYVTGSKASGATAGLVGYVFIFWIKP